MTDTPRRSTASRRIMKLITLTDPTCSPITVNADEVVVVGNAADPRTGAPAVGMQMLIFNGGAMVMVKDSRDRIVALLEGKAEPPAVGNTPKLFRG